MSWDITGHIFIPVSRDQLPKMVGIKHKLSLIIKGLLNPVSRFCKVLYNVFLICTVTIQPDGVVYTYNQLIQYLDGKKCFVMRNELIILQLGGLDVLNVHGIKGKASLPIKNAYCLLLFMSKF